MSTLNGRHIRAWSWVHKWSSLVCTVFMLLLCLTGLPLVSQPLPFGDYGGLPMKIIWALLDIATIVVLGSGLYLWLKEGNPAHERRPAARSRSAPQPAGRRYFSEHRRASAPVRQGAAGGTPLGARREGGALESGAS